MSKWFGFPKFPPKNWVEKDESEKMKKKKMKIETSPPTNLLPLPFCIANKFGRSDISRTHSG